MLLRVNIELNRDWVLSHRSDEVLPIEFLARKIADNTGCKVNDESLVDVTFVMETEDEREAIENKIAEIFVAEYGEDSRNALKITYPSDNPATKGENTTGGSTRLRNPRELQEEDEKFLNDLLGDKSIFGEDSDETTSSGPDPKKVLDEIKALAGADALARLAEELIRIAPEAKRRGLENVILSRCYLFVISDGCGFSTAVNKFATLLRALDLDVNERVREFKLQPYNNKSDALDPIIERINSLAERDGHSVVALDISEWMNRTDSQEFKPLLRAIEESKHGVSVIFRIPFVEREIVERVGASINDIVTAKPVIFPPASREQMLDFAINELKQRGFSVRKAALDPIWTRITEEKSDGRFYGIKTVKKVIDELIYAKLVKNAGNKKCGNIITAQDAMTLCKSQGETYKSAQQMLDELVGNEAIKKQVNEIVAQIQFAKLTQEDTPCIHMRFVGNPGTGKTTVARIIGKILKEKGILRIGNFIECHGRDLCGRYVGETAPKTASICRDAYGSVLFIDEAYSLYRDEGRSVDYGQEALDTLIAEMENHRDDLVVIMAGYTDDMEKLMEGNRGLRSRMPYTVEFPNFSREQLYEIFLTMLNSNIKYEEGVKSVAKTYFESLPQELIDSKEFSNARFVRNLYERVWAKAALRCQLANQNEVVLNSGDFEAATAEKDFAVDLPKKARLGFY